MHSMEIHPIISHIIIIFYRIGFWHRGADGPTVKEFRVKLFYSIFYSLFFISLAVGAINNENQDESVFLAEVAIIVAVLIFKLCILIWKQEEIQKLITEVCVFSIRDDDDYEFLTEKLTKSFKIVITFSFGVFVTIVTEFAVVPFVENEKTMFLRVAFPLDYDNYEIAFWICHIFLTAEALLSLVVLSFTIIIWYLMIHCSLRYQILGSELTKMGHFGKEQKAKISDSEKHIIYTEELVASMESYLHLKG